MKTIPNIDIKYGIAYFRILKKKKKKEKMANWKLAKVENLGNLEKTIPSFLISEFSILLYSQSRKVGFKNNGKKIPRFPSFEPGHKILIKTHSLIVSQFTKSKIVFVCVKKTKNKLFLKMLTPF